MLFPLLGSVTAVDHRPVVNGTPARLLRDGALDESELAVNAACA
jgi:hypothetical protein